MEKQTQEEESLAELPSGSNPVSRVECSNNCCDDNNNNNNKIASFLSPVEALRERISKKELEQKTLSYWLRFIGIEDESAFIWSFVSALIVFYLGAPGLFYLAGICMFCAWYWKGATLQKEHFLGIFMGFVFFFVFSAVFGIKTSQFERMQIGGPVTNFQCHQIKNGKFECQFFPSSQKQYQNRYDRKANQRHTDGRQKRKKINDVIK